MMNNGSTPNFTTFDPTIIPFQKKVMIDVLKKYDYSNASHEVLLSGSVGSAKSILMAHIAVLHCLTHPRARIMLGRRTLPDLKSTIYNKIIEHLEGCFKEGTHFTKNDSTATIKFKNGSEMISRSWADNRFSKVRSLELSGAIIEELTETDEPHAYNEIKMRVGRLPHVKQNFILSATNPDSPSHWAYKYFIEPNIDPYNHNTKHVYFSRTEDNPFLPSWYIDQLKRDLDPQMARRMLYGEWLEINKEVVYYQYDRRNNFKDASYKINPAFPIWITWDFNIGEGKPLSLCLFQFINDTMHIFDEVVVEGMRTTDSLDELRARGLLSHKNKYYITGDATGKARDTRSSRSDYDIIQKYFSNLEDVRFEMRNFKSNPPVRSRHNMVNAYCLNSENQVRLYVYKECKTVDEGLRLTALKKGGKYIEDDSKHFQHITTAVGYGLHSAKIYTERKRQATIRL